MINETDWVVMFAQARRHQGWSVYVWKVSCRVVSPSVQTTLLTDLYDTSKVTQIEGVVGLSGCRQQLGNGLAVHLKSGCDDARAQLLAALRKGPCAQVPCQDGLEDCHQCLVCHLQVQASSCG